MLRFYNAIANDGKMMEPYLVASIRDGDKEVEHHKPKVVNKQIASKKSVRQLQEMLRGVVNWRGQARTSTPLHSHCGKNWHCQSLTRLPGAMEAVT